MLTWQGGAQVAQDRGKTTLLKETGRQLTHLEQERLLGKAGGLDFNSQQHVKEVRGKKRWAETFHKRSFCLEKGNRLGFPAYECEF